MKKHKSGNSKVMSEPTMPRRPSVKTGRPGRTGHKIPTTASGTDKHTLGRLKAF